MNHYGWVKAAVAHLVETRPGESVSSLVGAVERMARMAGRGWTAGDERAVRAILARVGA